MQVHTFRADSVQSALQQVRQTLGSDACVLHTREKRESVFGFFSKTFIEVEATLDMPDASRLAASHRAIHSRTKAPQPLAHRAESRLSSKPPAKLDSNLVTNAESSQDKQTRVPVEQTNHTPLNQASDTPAIPRANNRPSLSPAMLEVYSDLVGNGVEAGLARELLSEVYETQGTLQLNDNWTIRASLTRLIVSKLRVSGSIELRDGKQQVVALVGPTGVGKTTTLAKIAAGFRFDLGCRVGLIALDTFRLGAVDQLLQYAELISAALEVVSSPEQVTAALQRLSDCDLVLLDTAGRSPHDADQLAELQKFLEFAVPQSTQLVVSATSSATYMEEVVERFSVLNPTNLLITKIDEAVNLGNWLGALRSNKLPISYLTNGQHVPQDIVVASARRLASLLLGNQHASTSTSL